MSIRRLVSWTLIAILGFPPGALAQRTGNDSTLLIDRGSTGTMSPAGGAATRAQSDPFTGAATLGFELRVPPGTGGMQPALALAYNNQRRADSWVGFGWSLSLGSIRRSLKRGIPSYDDAVDRFELDGQELVPDKTVANRFHTRRESFVRIDRLSSGVWEVRTKDGRVARFGTTEQSRIQRADGRVYEWLLAETEDLRGNAFTVAYDRADTGTAYPLEVRYTLRRQGERLVPMGGSASERVVRFVTEPRPDPFQGRIKGVLEVQTKRLARVEIAAGGALVRRYDLRYAQSPDSLRSLLADITERGSDAGTDATPKPGVSQITRFTYQSNVTAKTQGWAEARDWKVPGPFVTNQSQDAGARLADVNGDGLPDFVIARRLGSRLPTADTIDDDMAAFSPDSGVYLNTGTSFEAQPNPAFPLPQQSFFVTEPRGAGASIPRASFGTLLVDLDGDGRAELLGAPRFVRAAQDLASGVESRSVQIIATNTGRGWQILRPEPGKENPLGIAATASISRQSRTQNNPAGTFDGNLNLVELNGDGLPDLLGDESLGRATRDTNASSNRRFFAFGLGGGRFDVTTDSTRFATCATPEELQTDAPCEFNGTLNASLFLGAPNADDSILALTIRNGARFADVDGDGLDDQLRSVVAQKINDREPAPPPQQSAFLNDGTDFVRDDRWLPPPIFDNTNFFFRPPTPASSRDLGVRLFDINGDGRVDLVRRLSVNSLTDLWLNAGFPLESNGGSPWLRQPRNSPLQVPEALAFVDDATQDLGVRPADLNGDGMVDFIRAFGGRRQVFLNKGTVPDQLTSITNPLGGQTRIEYAPSTRFKNTGGDDLPDLPQVVQVVSAIVTNDAVNEPARTTMDYAGGLYDAQERELRGFAVVSVKRPDGRTTQLEFHQDIERAGLMKSAQVFDSRGIRLTATEMTYTDDDVPGEPFARLPASVTSLEDPAPGASGEPRRTRTEMQYERDRDGRFRFGRVSAMTELGEVGAEGRDLDASDTRTTELEYAENEDLYLVELPGRELLRGGVPGSGALLRESRFFYDGDTSGRAAPRRGLLTRRVELALEAETADPTTTFDHDEFGNVTAVTDPRANAGEGGGTTRFEFDPVFRTFMVSTTNALSHTTRFAYEPGAGCAAAPPFGSGLVYAEQGPNDIAESRAMFCYDALGRPTLERGPDGLTEARTTYVDIPGGATVTRTVRATLAGGVRNSITALDGFGRAVRTSTDGPGRNLIITEQTFDAMGRVSTATAPRFPSDAAAITTFGYDALDRMTRIERPGEGRVTTIQFDRGKVTTTTPAGMRINMLDAFGRVTRVEEFPDEGGPFISRYSYRPSGELTRFVDAEGNTTTLSYDGLGRRRMIQDPDTGLTETLYDTAGNITISRDAAGEVRSMYDALDRLLQRSIENEVETSFKYDTAMNGIGLLAERTDRAGTFGIQTYDRLGRALDAVRMADSIAHRFQMRFDPLGQVLSRTLPSGLALAFMPDARGYLTGVQRSGEALIQNIEIEADGRPRGWTASSGVRTAFGYEPGTRRLSGVEVRARRPLEVRTFNYDAADRIRTITDTLDASRNQSFGYDALARLRTASGPYAPAFKQQTLQYRYGPTGNLLCLDATKPSETECEGGRAMIYPPGGPSTVRPHAPSSVDGQPVRYAPSGELLQLGTRRYEYDPLGQIRSAFEGDRTLAAFTYDGAGVRVKTVESPGPDEIIRYQLSDDFEWNATRRTATTYARVAGQLVAAITEPYDPAAAAAATPLQIGTAAWLGWLWALALLSAAGAALALALARRRAEGTPLPRAVLASVAVWLLTFGLVPGAVWAGPPLDGDLNSDGRLDAADALLALRFASGLEIPTPAQLERGDVAPLEDAPESPSRIDQGDALLLLRVARGEDVDGDGLSAAEELAAGASPFRADTDRDGIGDAEEIAAGRDTGRDELRLAGGSASRRPRVAKSGGEADAVSGDVRFFHTDALGSTVLVTDAAGELVSRTVYRPYGRAVAPSADAPADVPEFGFTGQRFEAPLGIYDYRARFYDPALGRFLQPDALVPDPGDPQSFNRYSYVRNDPVNRIDPTGNADIGGLFRSIGRFFSGVFQGGNPASLSAATANLPTLSSVAQVPTSDAIENIVVTGRRLPPDSPAASPSRARLLLAGGVAAAGFIPGIGEGLDLATLFAPDSTLFERGASGVSLAANFFTAGFLPNFGGAARAARAGGRSVDELSEAAQALDRNGRTIAGRSLEKKSGRGNSAFPKPSGNADQVNRTAQEVVDDILTDPQSTMRVRELGRFGEVTEIIAPDGRGLRFSNADGSFIGFTEP